MSFNSGMPTSESPMSLGQPDHTSGLTGQDGGQPDHAHSQDMTDTRHARDQYDPIDGRPDRDPQPDENIGQTLAVIKEGIRNLAAALHSFVSNEGMSSRTTKSKKHKHRRASSESEPSEEDDTMDFPPKRLRVDDDALSIAPSNNDIHDFLNGSVATGENTDSNAGQTNNGDNNTVNDTPASVDPAEIKFLDSLNNALNEDEQTGPKVVQNLADIAIKRWGKPIANDKLKTLLAKHAKPENCAELTVPRVNLEIWSSMNNSKKSADIWLSNIQQVMQQGTFGMLKACDSLLTTPTDTKTALSHTIDALALMGHAVGALSRIRRDNIKLTLNPVYYSLCNWADDPVPHSPLLFGDDLAKQVRDAKETSNISQSLGVSRNRQPRNNRSTYRYDNRFANSRQPI